MNEIQIGKHIKTLLINIHLQETQIAVGDYMNMLMLNLYVQYIKIICNCRLEQVVRQLKGASLKFKILSKMY